MRSRSPQTGGFATNVSVRQGGGEKHRIRKKFTPIPTFPHQGGRSLFVAQRMQKFPSPLLGVRVGVMQLMVRNVSSAILLAVALGAATAHAQIWPTKPVRIITAEPGTGNDLIARLIVSHLSSAFGQQFVVDNRGLVAVEMVVKAAPDGYTLLSYGPPLWLTPLLRQVSYDPLRDLAPITLAGSSPNILAIHPSLPAKTVPELLLLAKKRPGELNYSSSSTGASPHLAAELLKSMAGINIVRVAYKGSGQALVALIGGQVHIMFPNAGTVAPHLKSTRVRALAVTTLKRSPLLPQLPTISDAGLRGFDIATWFGIFAPAGTPPDIVARLNGEIVRILHTPEMKERLALLGAEPIGNKPDEFAAFVKAEIPKYVKVIQASGARAD